jgi:GT2 family glycosyltransferase
MPDVSIVIVSFNARDHLGRCLTSVYATLGEASEVIVVDNASPDGSAAFVAANFPLARLIRNDMNHGFAIAANMGARAAGGDVIVFLNPDCVLDAESFSAPAAYLRAHPDAGAIGIKVLDPDGGLQLSVRRFPDLSVAFFNRYSFLTRMLPKNRFSRRYLLSDWGHDSLSDVDWVSGACLLTTRAVLERVGDFDEGYFWGFEDVDFCQRLHGAGLRVVYFPETNVRHQIGASARTVPSRALIARHRGMWRYYRRYLSRGWLVDAAVFLGICVRCGFQLTAASLKRNLSNETS